MFSLIDISPHIVKPPFVLMRENKFPNCPKLFATVSAAHTRPPADRLWVGWRFTGICRITGLLWTTWAIIVVLLTFVVAHGVYHWFDDGFEDHAQQWHFGLRCVDVEAAASTVVFVLLLVYEYTSQLAQNLAESCVEYLHDQPSRPVRKPRQPITPPPASVAGVALQG